MGKPNNIIYNTGEHQVDQRSVNEPKLSVNTQGKTNNKLGQEQCN